LSEQHRLALEELGFSPEMAKRRVTDRMDWDWEERYEAMLKFKEKYGHVRVPRGYGSLGCWVNAQRMSLGDGDRGNKVKRDRIKKLNEIGFVWNYNEWLWNDRYEKLREYHQEHRNTNVPKSSGVLGEWCELQRVQYSLYERGKKSNLTAQRVAKLNELGFDWDRGVTLGIEFDLAWFAKLKLLKQFYAEHGHFDVPRKHPTLGHWVSRQRQNYKGILRGEKNSLNEQRRSELAKIGFFDDISKR
jgi:hypothetical protein